MRSYHAANGNPERTRIIGFENSFHGRTIATVAAAGNKSHMQNFVPLDQGFDHVQWGDIESLRASIGSDTAGVILEPIQGEGGIRPVSKEYLEAIRTICDQEGLLLMFDEVQCGVGRSGHLFAHQYYGVYPDVMALAKGLGGGFPIGACLTNNKVGKTMVVGTHGSTFGGNPLAAVVANAVMDLLLEDKCLPGVIQKGEYLRNQLSSLQEKYPKLIDSVHGLGLMLGIKCEIPNTELTNALKDRGLLVVGSGSNMVRLLPPLNIEHSHLERAIGIMDSALGEM
jgi:acetylornithine/N-succinyldiaminopimelate aminotransferase